ncbi:MAG: type IV toxin-antitoxin system AbiEi family antitoxin domain-containing protein [Candidatus Taylorbacteria bacterium]|nr:type IV toxin-antitoxin system AbiEi family antitoxin domain-containing protein [Candidatus Taylorbacteria bacterium]
MAKIKDTGLGIFTARDVQALFKVSKVSSSFLLHRYNKTGFIIRIKRGLYAFPDTIPPEIYLANKLYAPSYISREFALSYHGIIPETVYEMTSVSTKATRRFEKLGKIYSYRHIRKEAFTGYSVIKQQGYSFIIADPEKAFVDTLYYRILFGKEPMSRFNKDKIDIKKVMQYAKLFNNRKLTAVLITTFK